MTEQVPAETQPTAPIPASDPELDAILAEIRGEDRTPVAAKEAEPEPAVETAESQPDVAQEDPVVQAAQQKASEQQEEAKTEVEPEPGLARGLASLARRENKLREQEKAFRDKEAQLNQLQAQIASIRQRAIEDPAGFYREVVGAEKTAEIAAQLYYNELGEAAPKEFQEKKATWSLEKKLEQLQKQIAEKERVAAAQAQEARALSYLQAQTARIPDSLPFLKAEAADDASYVARSLYTKITQLSQAGALGGATTDEEIAAVAAQSLNDDFKRAAERYLRIHGPKQAPKTQSPVAEETKPVMTKSLSSQATAMTKPRRPPANRDEEIEQLIEDLKSRK